MPLNTLSLVPIWSQTLQADPAGLVLAREKGWLLAWDQNQWIYLLNSGGTVQAQVHVPDTIAQCVMADDGSGLVVIGKKGELRWLAPDLTTRWEKNLQAGLNAAAVDPLGHFLAVADDQNNLFFLDRGGKILSQSVCPRPLQHIAFLPGLPLLAGCADFGLFGVFDKELRWNWREKLLVNVGALAVNGTGSTLLLACFSDGVNVFTSEGKAKPRLPTPEPCRFIAQNYQGDRILIGGMGKHIYLLDTLGQELGRHAFEKRLAAVALGARGEAIYAALHSGGIVKLRVKQP